MFLLNKYRQLIDMFCLRIPPRKNHDETFMPVILLNPRWSDCPLILMELAEYGNLRDYLRKHRGAQSDEFGEYILAQDSSESAVESLGHELDASILLRFAQHVAAALAYFESLQVGEVAPVVAFLVFHWYRFRRWFWKKIESIRTSAEIFVAIWLIVLSDSHWLNGAETMNILLT